MRRIIAGYALAIFAVAAVVLLLSDRVGNLLGDVVGVITRAGRKVEQESGVNLIDRSDVPGEADQIFHALFWGSGMFAIGWILRRRVPIFFTALAVGAISLAFELAQPLLSATRAIESTDAVANLIGVAIATVVLFVVVATVRWIYGDDRRYVEDRAPSLTGPFRDDTTDELFLPAQPNR